jgi:hypothetical protein
MYTSLRGIFYWGLPESKHLKTKGKQALRVKLELDRGACDL